MGENLGWPKYQSLGISIAEGEESWQRFAATASRDEINLALQAFSGL